MRETTITYRLLVLAHCALGVPTAALAQQPPASGLPAVAANPAVQDAWAKCNGDIQRLCPNVQSGGGRVVRCLVANAASLTPECRAGMMTAKSALGR